MEDKIKNPDYYKHGNIECIDAIKSALSDEEFIGFLKGQVIKYIWRQGLKGPAIEDTVKIQWYIDKLYNRYKNDYLCNMEQ